MLICPSRKTNPLAREATALVAEASRVKTINYPLTTGAARLGIANL